MPEFYFEVPGEPVAKERPRVTRRGTFTPKKTKFGETTIRQYFNAKYPRHQIDETHNFSVNIPFFCCHPRKRDIDNMLKSVLDALNKLLWKDDKQVVYVTLQKIEAQPNCAKTNIRAASLTEGGLPS